MSSVVIAGDTSGSVSVTVPAVAGSNTITIPAATGTVLTSVSPASDLPSSIKGPAFSATGVATTVSTAVYTKLQFNSKQFDTNNNFDAVTNFRFTPTVAGYYQINLSCQFYPAASNAGNINIYKNGALYNAATVLLNSLVYPQASVSALVYMNGSTDYVEGYSYQASGGNLTVAPGMFSGALVRAA